MNRIIFLGICHFVVSFSFAQTNFHKVYEEPNIIMQNSVLDTNNNFYVSGQDSTGRISITKLDSNGVINWSFQFGAFGSFCNPRSLILFNDTQLAVFATVWEGQFIRGLVLFLDTSGQIQMQRYIGEQNDTAIDIVNAVMVNDGYIVYSENIEPPQSIMGVFTKIDFNGNILWQRSFYGDYLTTGIELPNGNILYPAFFNGSFYVFDPSFNSGIHKAWELLNGQDFYYCTKLAQGIFNNFYSIGYFWNNGIIVQVDSLNQTYVRLFGPPDISKFVQLIDMKQLSNTDWVLLGTYGLGNNAEAYDRMFLMHLNSSFSVLNSVILPDTVDIFPFVNYDLTISNNDKIYVTMAWHANEMPYLSEIICTDINFSNLCNADPFSLLNNADSMLLVFDDTILLSNYSSINLNSAYQRFAVNSPIYNCTSLSSTTEFEEDEFIDVFPNPVADFLRFNKVIDRVEVYDCAGMLKKQFMEQINTIELNELTAGIYFIRIGYKDKVYWKKIIKIYGG